MLQVLFQDGGTPKIYDKAHNSEKECPCQRHLSHGYRFLQTYKPIHTASLLLIQLNGQVKLKTLIPNDLQSVEITAQWLHFTLEAPICYNTRGFTHFTGCTNQSVTGM
jgi:hypothetical protein